MIVIVLLLAALGITGLLVAILVVAIRARLREREELARASQPGVPGAEDPAAGGAPRKPPLVPWLVASGITVVVVTLVGGMVMRSCQAVGERRARAREQALCGAMGQQLTQWFYTDWEQRKALPPPAEVPMELWGPCPAGNRFKYVGGSEVPLGKEERVLVVETGGHEVAGGPQRWAIVADPKFVASGQTAAEFQAAAGGGKVNWVYYGMFFKVRTLSEAEYETIRQAVEAAP